MSDTPTRENKMGTMPVPQLLISMSLPMMISMLVQALYNIVDSIFVAQISESALTAVSLAFPVQSLMIAVSAGTCVGMNALLSRSLGERKQEMADKTAMNGAFLALMGALAHKPHGFVAAAVVQITEHSAVGVAGIGTVRKAQALPHAHRQHGFARFKPLQLHVSGLPERNFPAAALAAGPPAFGQRQSGRRRQCRLSKQAV